MEQTARPISIEDESFFHREGYLVIPSFLNTEFNSCLRADVDQLMIDRADGSERLLVAYPDLGLLTSHPALTDILQILMGPRFAMHHIHAVRQDAGAQGVYWHQDYEQLPQTNRSHLMVHVFYYLNGLNGEVGDLLVLPRSQDRIVARDAMMSFGTEDLPGSLCFDDLSPGSAVIVHSALWHARRPKPGGENESRYFIDVSYCQNGVLWPSYGKRQAEINRTALAQGLGRNGRYDFLYDSSQFFDQDALTEDFDQTNKGSIVLQMKGISMGDQG
ncbi:MAG: hypothetical protein DF168_00678 [Candidatus Moanabacter tarae]|uniref:Phytanoyl-CoA dioxygenase n=1 Tax=Candidatus Moanibacter tarae TaxID=2200854 RepID=A0A2Z4AEU3_9BACT|nr:MAG: hypothetical protein DF168_00678 [Candidatus Moanabacter tarae]|tara:strand:+ start:42280 stop:43101 length:822 start_codon:yes stop_codon:yes gene_type:complete